MKIFFKGIDAYCPECNAEIYAMNISNLLTTGGNCTSCGFTLDAGECIPWTTAEGDKSFSTELGVQHISNILCFLEKQISDFEADDHDLPQTTKDEITKPAKKSIKIFTDELYSRGATRLKYVPYYPEELEDRIFNRGEKSGLKNSYDVKEKSDAEFREEYRAYVKEKQNEIKI